MAAAVVALAQQLADHLKIDMRGRPHPLVWEAQQLAQKIGMHFANPANCPACFGVGLYDDGRNGEVPCPTCPR